jgi:hypothetical protein
MATTPRPFRQGAAEGEAVRFAQGADVGGDEVRAGGAEDLEARLRQARREQVPLSRIGGERAAQPVRTGLPAVPTGSGDAALSVVS